VFTNPIFALILARIFLKEKATWHIWIATFLAFIGISFIVRPTMISYNKPVFACLLAAIVFALLDIINKKIITQESILFMLFFSNLMAAVCMLPVIGYSWKIPSLFQLFILGMLGVGGNLILFFLLKAFKLSSVSSLAPIKYIELVVSIVLGYLFFNEWPTISTCIGAMIIISCSCFVTYYQNRVNTSGNHIKQ
jgi:S-adenosylmethionine uptake transporter